MTPQIIHARTVVDVLEMFLNEALRDGLIRYETTLLTDGGRHIRIEYREPLGATQEDGYRYAHLCGLDTARYEYPEGVNVFAVMNRVTLMLADKCRSLQQDVNILMKH
jgi:hypothetical protein